MDLFALVAESWEEHESEVLDKVSRIDREIDSFDDYLQVSEIVGMSGAILEMKDLIQDLQVPAEIFETLQKQYMKRLAHLIVRLNELFREMYVIQSDFIQVSTAILSTPCGQYQGVSHQDLGDALEPVGIKDQLVQGFLESVSTLILSTLVTNECSCQVTQGSKTASFSILKKSNQVTLGNAIENIQKLSEFLSLNFIRFPPHLWEAQLTCLMPLIEKECPLEQNEKWDDMYQLLLSFEDALIDLQLFQDHPLSDHLSKMSIVNVSKERIQLLEMVKDILTNHDMNTVQVPTENEPGLSLLSGKDKKKEQQHVFYLKPCKISVQVQTLVEMMYSLSNYQVRDILDMLRCIDIPHDPTSIMLHYNNCYYIVHHITTMNHQKDSLLDLVPFFKSSGENTLLTFLNEQQKTLKELSQPNAIRLLLQTLANAWKPIAIHDLYFDIMKRLVQIVQAKVSIEDVSDLFLIHVGVGPDKKTVNGLI